MGVTNALGQETSTPISLKTHLEKPFYKYATHIHHYTLEHHELISALVLLLIMLFLPLLLQLQQ
jgi:hypothetical protein